MLAYPDRVTIVEVGPRDGLQNEDTPVATADKVAFVDRLSESGLTHIEVGAFVSPARIPQLADTLEVCARISRRPGVTYSALVPNVKGYERAVGSAGLRDIAVFLSATESHNRANIGCSIDEAFERYAAVLSLAERDGIRVRGYVSTAFGCPYEGHVSIDTVVGVARRLHELGCVQVSLGDTVGLGNPRHVAATVERLAAHIGLDAIALHLHDTRGTALANALAGLSSGITTFDASVGGLGGCPYAPGATGNVATDELVFMLEEMGVSTGVSLDVLMDASTIAARALGKELPSRWITATRATAERNRHA